MENVRGAASLDDAVARCGSAAQAFHCLFSEVASFYLFFMSE
jgi:hypothetical protein